MTGLRATVVICTRNRAATLRRVLEAFRTQVVPAEVGWELLVVDNGSTDDTAAMATSFADHLPLRVVQEVQPGLSSARNRATLEARGEYLLWIDDDALPAPGWIAAYLEAFDAWPDAALFGGPIEVAFDRPPPAWFQRAMPVIGGVYGQRQLGTESRALATHVDELPFGGNFVTRADVQRRFRYDTALGRHPDHPARGAEELDVLLSMLEAGLEGRWVPSAKVWHLQHASSATTAFIAERIAAYGAYRVERSPPAGRGVGGAPPALWWKWLGASLAYCMGRVCRSPEWWIRKLVTAAEARGAIRALRSRR